MPRKQREKYRIHALTIDDALNLIGILSGGGLAGQAADALGRMEREGNAAALDAFAKLLMGALANRSTRDELRGLLFTLWKTTEDEQASEDDLDVQGRLEPKYDDEGNLDKKSAYYRKLKRFYQLPPDALPALAKAIYQAPGFSDFLQSLREMLPAESLSAGATASNGTTGLEAVRSDA